MSIWSAKTGDALNSIVGRVNQISKLVSDIASGAAEQSTGLSEINTGVTQLDQVTQQNAAMVEEATAAGHMLHTDAGKLADLMAGFNMSRAAVVSNRPAPAAGPQTPSAHGMDMDSGFCKAAPMPLKAANGGAWEDF